MTLAWDSDLHFLVQNSGNLKQAVGIFDLTFERLLAQ